jgi:hypothetical protein
MKLLILTYVFLCTLIGTSLAEPPPDSLVKKLTAAIHSQCPDAAIKLTDRFFVASYDTMVFTVHGRLKTGEILSTTYQVVGPNVKGFILAIHAEKGLYNGQAIVPQIVQEPYYVTFIDSPPTEDGKGHYSITFSYGSGLDPKLKKSIFDALPKTK